MPCVSVIVSGDFCRFKLITDMDNVSVRRSFLFFFFFKKRNFIVNPFINGFITSPCFINITHEGSVTDRDSLENWSHGNCKETSSLNMDFLDKPHRPAPRSLPSSTAKDKNPFF